MDIRKLLTRFVLVVLCLTLATPAFAIEKRKKDPQSTKPDTASVVRPAPAPTQPKPDVKPADKPKNPPVFNDFIDVNRNGIDDRLEQGGFVAPPKRPPQAQPPSQPAVKKHDSTKADPAPKKAPTAPKVVEKKKDK